jgi:2-phospho-L-lactate guanylyltransferase
MVLVPVKAFDQAKGRLAAVLDPAGRASLAERLAAGVVAAAAPLPVVVACADEAVAHWAAGRGARVVRTPGRSLNGDVTAAVATLSAEGVARIIVAHADLPLAKRLAWVGNGPGVTIVTDRHGDGTNVLSVPTGGGFVFGYGPGSCAHHLAEARRLGWPVRVFRHPQLSWDIDTPADLTLPT